MTATRRGILKTGLGVVALGAAGGTVWLATGPKQPEPGIRSALTLLAQLEDATTISAQGAWSAATVFHHLAQSVEMSLRGYPEHKAALFKRTAGATALAVFRRQGRMRHALDEPIPGAPALPANDNVGFALMRLRDALIEFDGFTGPLAPHFAYGALTHEQYAVAHAMHLNNHMLEIVVS